MQKTGAEIARLCNVSRQAVDNFIRKHKIIPTGKKGKLKTYDCTQEPLAAYLKERSQPSENSSTIQPQTLTPKKNSNKEIKRISKPLNDLLAGRVKPGQKPAEVFFDEAWKLAKKNGDAMLFFKLGQIASKEDNDEAICHQAIKTEQEKEQIAQEKAERLRIENEIRRGEYMGRATVKLLWGKNYAVDTSILQPIGQKLADTIDALPAGVDRRKKIQAIIDNEIYAALEMKQRLMLDFLQVDSEDG